MNWSNAVKKNGPEFLWDWWHHAENENFKLFLQDIWTSEIQQLVSSSVVWGEEVMQHSDEHQLFLATLLLAFNWKKANAFYKC